MKPSPINSIAPTCIEICSGAGGQALGLEMAGFEALAHVETARHACATLRQNRPGWNVLKKCRVNSDQWEDWKHRFLRSTQILGSPEACHSGRMRMAGLFTGFSRLTPLPETVRLN
jgi:hypothetical protein